MGVGMGGWPQGGGGAGDMELKLCAPGRPGAAAPAGGRRKEGPRGRCAGPGQASPSGTEGASRQPDRVAPTGAPCEHGAFSLKLPLGGRSPGLSEGRGAFSPWAAPKGGKGAGPPIQLAGFSLKLPPCGGNGCRPPSRSAGF